MKYIVITKKALMECLSIALIIFFSYTLANKLLQVENFKLNIAKTSLFHGVWVDVIAYLALLSESVCILFMVFTRRIGFFLTWIMMFAFTVYIIVLYILHRYEVCGCGGILNGLSFHWHLLINICLLLTTSLLLYYEERSK